MTIELSGYVINIFINLSYTRTESYIISAIGIFDLINSSELGFAKHTITHVYKLDEY